MSDIPILRLSRVPVEALRAFCLDAALAIGFPVGSAERLTGVLIAGSTRTLPGQGQGVQGLPTYYERVKAGVIDPQAIPVEVSAMGAIAHMDARRAAGSVAGSIAMTRAAELAKAFGIGAVAVRDSTHFGVAAYYSLLAAAQGCAGFTFTNAAPEIAPWGGTEGRVGTNPWSIAVPTRRPWALVVDAATSTSGKGMIGWFAQAGRPIPSDWALTAEGLPTTDALLGKAGTLYPLGGPKGYAIAALIDAVTGVLAGASFGRHCSDQSHQDLGHLFIALNIAAFIPLEEFTARLDELIDDIHDTPPVRPGETIMLPGELEASREAECATWGVPFLPERLAGLVDMAEELGIPANALEDSLPTGS